MITAKVTVQLPGLLAIEREVKMGALTPEVQGALRKWAARIKSYLKRRFAAFSQGGGDWPALKNPRKRRGGASSLILRDTGTLMEALGSGPGGSTEIGPGIRLRVGYGGSAKHPSSKGRASIADIASFHQQGAPMRGLPVRTVVDAPSQDVLDACAKDIAEALQTRAARLMR